MGTAAEFLSYLSTIAPGSVGLLLLVCVAGVVKPRAVFAGAAVFILYWLSKHGG
jgi:hypothetical protein